MIGYIAPAVLEAMISDAIRAERPLQITYRAADGEITERVIEPYELDITRAGHVIVRAMDRRSGAPRSFRVDRFIRVTPTSGPFLLGGAADRAALQRVRAQIADIDPDGFDSAADIHLGPDAMRWTPDCPVFIP